MNGMCEDRGLVYRATVISSDEAKKKYTGMTGTSFKERHGTHLHTFKYRVADNNTALSNYVRKLKDKGFRL